MKGELDMRITKKDLDRLKYVERTLDTVDAHLAKVVHNVLQELNPEFIYVLQEEGCWEGDITGEVEVYASFADAMNKYKELKKRAQDDMNEWTQGDELEESEQIDEDAESVSYEIYRDGYFNELHNTITIERKEVI